MIRSRWMHVGITAACAALVAVASLARPSAQTPSEPTLRFVQSNGIRMRIAEMGKGPLVLLLHGWPESWYSWRHQLPAIAAAGFHAVAPDMRGYGQTDKPAAVADYDIHHLTADVVGLIDALGEKTAVVVGHDWGSIAFSCGRSCRTPRTTSTRCAPRGSQVFHDRSYWMCWRTGKRVSTTLPKRAPRR